MMHSTWTDVKADRATVDQLCALMVELDARRADIVKTQEAIKSELRRLRPEPGRYPAGDLRLDISPNRRFNGMRAALILPDRTLSTITTVEVDAARARHVLSPEEYAACQTRVGENRVRIT
jgi:hypothetical protein